MANVEKVSVALSPELLDMVREAVDSGAYGSASEVIREALRDWKLRKPLREIEVERLRSAWSAGIESGPSTPFSIDETKRRARERFAAARKD